MWKSWLGFVGVRCEGWYFVVCMYVYGRRYMDSEEHNTQGRAPKLQEYSQHKEPAKADKLLLGCIVVARSNSILGDGHLMCYLV